MAIRTKLMEHQKLITKFIKDLPFFGIFAEYGTGKTLCALDHINTHKYRKTLVISTKTAIQSTWPDEIKEHTNFQYVVLVGSRKHKLNQLYLGLSRSHVDAGYYHSAKTHPVIFLINFDGVKNVYNELVQANFDLILIDESTKIKSPKTTRTQAIWKLGETGENRGIMTGFPVTENIANIYSQIKFLDRGETFGSNFYAFLNRYFVKLGPKKLPKKKAVKEIMEKIQPFCIRVSGSVLNLPPKNYIKVPVPMTEQQKDLLGQLNDYFMLEFGNVSIDTQYVFTLINKSLQICDGFIRDGDGNLEVVDTNKDDALLDELEAIDLDHNKVIIWCSYKFSIRKLKKLLKVYDPLTLTGETEDANKVVKQFQHGKYPVLLAIQKKASESITLTSCNHAIYYSNGWSADLRYNSEARIYRKGSEKHKRVFYTDLLVKGTVEEKVIECLRKKKSLVDELKAAFGGIDASNVRRINEKARQR